MMSTAKHRWRFAIVGLVVATSVLSATAQETTGRRIAAALDEFVKSKSLAGAVVLVADKDKVLALESVGHADIEHNSLMRNDAVFWIASQSKPITAAGLMLLVDDGKVSLDDPVEKYLPEFKAIRLKGERPETTMSVRHLLAHTSGLPFQSAEERPTLDKLTLKEAVTSYARTPLLSEPGSKYQYSNAGINAAGRIIEVVSGMSYEDFMDKRLFGPLGMKDTTFWPSEEQVKRLARSYRPNKGKDGLEATTIVQLKYPLSDRKRQPMPAGGLFSTATDVAHFCQMMLGGGVYKGKRILSEDAVKELSRRQTGKSLKVSYGLGFATAGDGFGHGGAMSTQMWIDTKHGLVTVFLVQHAGFPGNGGQSYGAFRQAVAKEFAAGK